MTNTNKLNNATYGEGIPFDRCRRITGYLVPGGLARFNDGKREEVRNRTTHGLTKMASFQASEKMVAVG